jgi:hypothetical protein
VRPRWRHDTRRPEAAPTPSALGRALSNPESFDESLLVLAAALGFALPAAWAAPPPASGTFNYDVSLTVSSFPASHSFACGSVSIDAAPLPTVSAIGSGGCTSVLQAIFGYYVEIVAPVNVLVPVSVASTATLSATGSA